MSSSHSKKRRGNRRSPSKEKAGEPQPAAETSKAQASAEVEEPASSLRRRAKKRTDEPAVWAPPLWVMFAVPAVLALIIRVWYLRELWVDFPFFRVTAEGYDQHTYDVWAQQIAGGDWMSREQGVFYYAPLYPYLLGIVYAVAGADNMIAGFTLNAFLGIAATVAAAGLGRRLFGNLGGLIAGVAMALNGTQVAYEGILLNDAALPALVLGALWAIAELTAREDPEPNPVWWAVPGALLGLLIVGRGSNLLPAGALGLWLLIERFRMWRASKRWQAFLPVLAFGVAMAIPVGTVVTRNVVVGKRATLTTNAPVNFYLGNAPGSPGVFGYPPGFEDIQARINKLPAREKGAAWWAQLREDLGKEPGALPANLWRKTMLFANSWDAPDNLNTYFLRRYLTSLKFTFGALLLYAFGAAGIILTARDWRRLLPVYLFAGVFAVSLIMVFVSGRYKLPFLGILCVFAGGGISRTWTLFRGGQNGWAIGWAVAVVAGLVLFAPRPHPENQYADLQRPNEYLQNAAAFERADRFDEALALYRDGKEQFPALQIFDLRILRAQYQTQDWPGVLSTTQPIVQSGRAPRDVLEMHLVALNESGRRTEMADVARRYRAAYPESPLIQSILAQQARPQPPAEEK